MDYESEADLEEGYEIDSPESDNMVLDAIVGIMDPLRGDVKEAVATAQRAGVMVSHLLLEAICRSYLHQENRCYPPIWLIGMFGKVYLTEFMFV